MITSSGGAGVGADFVTDLAVVAITGVAPVGATGITVNIAGASITFDAATGEYSITFTPSEGVNLVTISASSIPWAVAVTLTGVAAVASEG